MSAKAFNVDLPGLLRVFGGHLDSSPDVFVRELVQNAVDAIVEQRRIEPSFEGRVEIRSDEGNVVIEDDGVGLDEARIELCLARIGYSSKTTDDELLGRFGIGLLSAFLVASEIIVDTCREDGTPFRWRATPDGTYTTSRGERTTRGTTVRLAIAPEHRRYARKETLREILDRYVRYLSFEVCHEGERVTVPAPWVDGKLPARADREPLAVLPLVPTEAARGCLWISSDPAPADGARIDVYLRGMLLEKGTRKLLPRWATLVSGIVDTTKLAPTASRETFVDDTAAASLEETVTRALLDGLSRMSDREIGRVLAVHYLPLRGACVDAPELLRAIGDRMPFHTNFGRTDLRTLLESQPERVLRYVDTVQDFAHTVPLANAQGIALVDASYTHDVPFLKAYAEQRGIALRRLTVSELELLIQPAPELGPRFVRVLGAAREALEPFDVVPELGRFEPSAMPAFLVSDATGTEERGRALAKTTQSSLVQSLLENLKTSGPAHTRFVLNAQNRLVAALPSIADEGKIRRVVRMLYAQSSMTLRRSLSIAQSRAFSDDLLALLTESVDGRDGTLDTLN